MKRFLTHSLALTLCLMLAGCSKTETTTTTTGGGGGEEKKETAGGGAKKVRLAFVTNNASDFWTIARAGCNKAAGELPNVAFEFKIPQDGTAATQTQILDDLLAKGIDGIAISPVDPANEPPKLTDVA